MRMGLRADVAVVGGGPCGAMAAAVAARGAKVLLLERAPERRPVCAGIISLKALEELELPRRLVLSELRGAVFHGPDGIGVTLTAPEPKAVVVGRPALDRFLRERAAEAGVEVLWEAAVGWDGRELRTSGGERMIPEVLIGADGALSGVARWAGLPGPEEILVAFQAEVEAELERADHVELFLGREFAPGFFAWAVPAGNRVLIGLASTTGKKGIEYLRSLLRRHFPGARVLSLRAGLIPIGSPPRTSRGRVLLVGNAAAQTKPLSGGGIYFGAMAARIAGELAAAGRPADYEGAWRAILWREIHFGLRARKLFLSLSDAELKKLLGFLSRREIQEFLVTEGDFDRHSELLRALRGRPDLWPLGMELLRALGGLGRFLP